MNRPIALITGATAGFGEACAEALAAAGYDLIITGRRARTLEAVAAGLQSRHDARVLALAFDVRDRAACEAAVAGLEGAWREVSVLVNNAGLALGLAPVDEGLPGDWDTMIDTNVKGLLYMSRAAIPLLKATGRGHIVNIGSTAAKDVYPGGGVYCATKRAVEALSQAMRIDLLPYGIKVTAIHPGAARTEFSKVRFKGDETRADKVYEGFEPLSAADVAEVVRYCVSLPPHVCINDLVLTCTAQANAFFTHRQA